MTVNYTLEDEKVKEIVTVPAREEVKELGEKDEVIASLEAEKAKCDTIIATYTEMKANIQTKLDAINSL